MCDTNYHMDAAYSSLSYIPVKNIYVKQPLINLRTTAMINILFCNVSIPCLDCFLHPPKIIAVSRRLIVAQTKKFNITSNLL